MDKFISTNTGGLPFKSDDLRFMDAAYRDAFKAIVKGLLGNFDKGIISGCTVSDLGSTLSVQTGYIAYGDEIWFVPAHTVTKVVGQTMYFYPEITWDAAGSKVFKSTDVHNTYQVRRMKLFFAATPPADAMLYDDILWDGEDFSSIYNTLNHNLQLFFVSKTPMVWTAASLLNGWSAVDDPTYYPVLKYRKDIGESHVEIRGWLQPDDVTNDLIFTLPVGHRPSWAVDVPIHQGTTQCRLVVDPVSGHVSLLGYSTSGQDICICVRFPLT